MMSSLIDTGWISTIELARRLCKSIQTIYNNKNVIVGRKSGGLYYWPDIDRSLKNGMGWRSKSGKSHISRAQCGRKAERINSREVRNR